MEWRLEFLDDPGYDDNPLECRDCGDPLDQDGYCVCCDFSRTMTSIEQIDEP